MKKSLIVTSIVVVFLLIVSVIYGVSISNTEIRTRNLAEAQQENCEAYFDKMWKILQQQANVADKYKEAFKEIYPQLIAGRYSGGQGQLMQWIQEHNPKFDPSLYGKLMNSIEAQREGFFNEQKKLISINNTHKNLLTTFPSSLIVGDREPLNIKIIKSVKTEEVYESGQENDINLFN
jgi:hypothetical protein